MPVQCKVSYLLQYILVYMQYRSQCRQAIESYLLYEGISVCAISSEDLYSMTQRYAYSCACIPMYLPQYTVGYAYYCLMLYSQCIRLLATVYTRRQSTNTTSHACQTSQPLMVDTIQLMYAICIATMCGTYTPQVHRQCLALPVLHGILYSASVHIAQSLVHQIGVAYQLHHLDVYALHVSSAEQCMYTSPWIAVYTASALSSMLPTLYSLQCYALQAYRRVRHTRSTHSCYQLSVCPQIRTPVHGHHITDAQ